MLDRQAREKRVLDIIIRLYIDTAEPVGSRLVARELSLSSATIRNIMAELEEEGFIRQPYTSAGRVPTDKAYRLYVNKIIHRKPYYQDDKENMRKLYFSKVGKTDELTEYAPHLISTLTSYTGFTVSPEKKFYLDGTYHMLEQPEFRSIENFRPILQVLEEKEKMLEIMNSYFSEDDISVHIGEENVFDDLKSCSVITASYKVRRNVIGGVGLIGPTRMRYEKVIPLVEFISEATSRLLEEIYG